MRLILTFLLAFTIPTFAFAAENQERQKLLTAIFHCAGIANFTPQLTKLINAFNFQPQPEDFIKPMSEEEKAEFVLYLKSRPDIPNFTFLLPQFLSRASRNQTIKFNAIMTLLVIEKLGFNIKSSPAKDNCKVINFAGERIKNKLQFGNNKQEITYLIKTNKNYGAYVDDIIINNISLKFYYSEELEKNSYKNGLDFTINSLCKKSSVPTLKCS